MHWLRCPRWVRACVCVCVWSLSGPGLGNSFHLQDDSRYHLAGQVIHFVGELLEIWSNVWSCIAISIFAVVLAFALANWFMCMR